MRLVAPYAPLLLRPQPAPPEILLVAAARYHGRDLDRRPAWPAALPLTNLIAVTSASANGELVPGANWRGQSCLLPLIATREFALGR